MNMDGYNPLTPGMFQVNKPEKKVPSEVCIISDIKIEMFCTHQNCFLAFSNEDTATKYLRFCQQSMPEMCAIVGCDWDTLSKLVSSTKLKIVLFDYDPNNYTSGPYEVYFIS